MNNLRISQVTTHQNLQTLELVASDWLQQAKSKHQHAVMVESDKKDVFLDAILVIECILNKQPKTHSRTYIPTGNETESWKSEKREGNLWEFYVAFDRHNYIQGISVIHKIVKLEKIELAYLVTNPNNLGVITNAGRIGGIGTALLNYAVEYATHTYPEKPFVLTTYPSALKFYEALGFEKCERVENDFSPDVDYEIVLTVGGRELLSKKCTKAFKKVTEPQLEKPAPMPLFPYVEELAEVLGKIERRFDHLIHTCIAEYIGSPVPPKDAAPIETVLADLSL